MENNQKELSLSAYYYHFDATGVREIDEILAAVAAAGKAYHNTDCWNDDCEAWRLSTEGNTPVEWIQNAANRAAALRGEKP